MASRFPFPKSFKDQVRTKHKVSAMFSAQTTNGARLLKASPATRALTGARTFTATAAREKRTSDMTELDFKGLKVNQSRLMSDVHGTAKFGIGQRWGALETETGMARLSLTDSDKQVRDWFVRTTESLGCTVTVDQMGNIFAVRAGRCPELAPIYAGSHLDTQPAAGRYDGILGVMAGIEMLRVLQENQIETTHPVGVVNWTNEEGARFPITMLSSGVWAGAIPIDRAHELLEVGANGASLKSELERSGYLGAVPASHLSTPMTAHFELHIEQGPILESAHQKIGIVQGVQAYKWYTIEVQGRAAHTGTTPYTARSDALLAAAQMIVQSNVVSARLGALASTGILQLEPGSTNTIPDRVRFSLDVRAASDSLVESVEAQLKKDFESISNGQGLNSQLEPATASQPVDVRWTTDSDSPAVHFHSDCIDVVRKSAEAVLGDASLCREMTSGAGHDSVYTSRRCPTSMVFVPSRNGVSHHPEEWTSAEDCALGAEVLCQSIVRYDQYASPK